MRVGGGYLHVRDFVEQYTPREVALLEKRLSPWERLQSCRSPLERFQNRMTAKCHSLSRSNMSSERKPSTHFRSHRSFFLQTSERPNRHQSPLHAVDTSNILDFTCQNLNAGDAKLPPKTGKTKLCKVRSPTVASNYLVNMSKEL